MNYDKSTKEFFDQVCEMVRTAGSYSELDQIVTQLVDDYGQKNNLTLCEMDQIQNDIYKILNK